MFAEIPDGASDVQSPTDSGVSDTQLEQDGASQNDSALPPDPELPDSALLDSELPEPDSSLPDADVPQSEAGADSGAPFSVPNGDLRREALQWGSAPRVVFRYRPYSGSRPAWVSPGSGSGTIKTYARPQPLVDLQTLQLNGSSEGWLGNNAITLQPQGFTVRAWVRPVNLTGTRKIFSNTEGGKGIALYLADGQLRGMISIKSGTDTQRKTVSASLALAANQWYEVAFQAYRASGQYRLRLYINASLNAEATTPALDGIDNSSSHAAVGAEPTSNVLDTSWFSGEIAGVIVTNFPVDHDVLASPWIRDGSRYLGMPSYHDYLDTTDSIDARLMKTDRSLADTAKIKLRFGSPLLNDDYTPQGLGLSPDGRTLYLSYYWSDRDTGENPSKNPTVVAKVDMAQHRLEAIYRLYNESGQPLVIHAGGVANAHGYLYVPTTNAVLLFDPTQATQESAGNDAAAAPVYGLKVKERMRTCTTGSGIDYDPGRDALWILGDFQESSSQPPGVLDRFFLNSQGKLLHPSPSSCPSDGGSDERRQLPVPKVQGLMALNSAPNNPCFMLSTSYGDHPSEIYRWCPEGDGVHKLLTIPAGTEGIDQSPDGRIWTWSESGSARYQKRTDATPWDTLMPYVIGFDQ